MTTERPLSWGQRLWWLVTGRINGEVVPPTPRTAPPPDPPRPTYIPKCFPGILHSQGFPAGTPWLGDAEHMSDVDPSLTPEEVARRREEYQKMTTVERAAEWGIEL